MAIPKLNWIVVFAIVVLSIVLGVANNFRVFEERRVPFWGGFGQDEGAAE